MKRILKILGIIVAVIVLLIAIAGITINVRGIPSYDTQEVDLKVEMDSASIANGERLAGLTCANCHRGQNSTLLEGKKLIDIEEEVFGKVYSANITKHPEKGIGKYTDGELAFLLRTGIKKDGQYAPPWMVKFPHMADDDLEDIIAFFRSDHPSLEPSDKVQPACEPTMLVKFLCYVAFKPFPMPEKRIEKPDPNDKVAFGNYVANSVAQCFECHSADFKTNDSYTPENSIGFYGGGNPLKDLDGKIIPSPNITMDKNTGIGNWTEDEFVNAVKYGKRPDGSLLMFPMEKYTLLTDDEVKAIYAYLKTVPVIKNDVKALATN